jgi:hypothetical protein
MYCLGCCRTRCCVTRRVTTCWNECSESVFPLLSTLDLTRFYLRVVIVCISMAVYMTLFFTCFLSILFLVWSSLSPNALTTYIAYPWSASFSSYPMSLPLADDCHSIFKVLQLSEYLTSDSWASFWWFMSALFRDDCSLRVRRDNLVAVSRIRAKISCKSILLFERITERTSIKCAKVRKDIAIDRTYSKTPRITKIKN